MSDYRTEKLIQGYNPDFGRHVVRDSDGEIVFQGKKGDAEHRAARLNELEREKDKYRTR